MSWQSLASDTVFRSAGTTVVAAHDGRGHARLDVTTTPYGRAPADGGRLVCQAVHEARLCRAHHVEFALNASTPACGLIVEALHTQTGDDVEAIEMRRAGSSVIVNLELRPLPTQAPAPGVEAAPGAPERSGGGQRRAALISPA